MVRYRQTVPRKHQIDWRDPINRTARRKDFYLSVGQFFVWSSYTYPEKQCKSPPLPRRTAESRALL